MLNSIIVARVMLSFGPMTHKKLQKLCYYLYAWYYTILGDKIECLNFEAWVHGPVSPEIYNNYKEFGWDDIPKSSCVISSDSLLYKIAQGVFEKYGNLDGDELEDLTHIEEPWKVTRKGLTKYESSTRRINDYVIEEYYSKNKNYEYFNSIINQ